MAVRKKYSNDIEWGTSGAGTSPVTGKVLSARRKSGASFYEQEDGDGELFALIICNDIKEMTVEVLAGPAATVPEVGADATMGGITYVVMDAEERWASKEGKKVSLTLKAWTGAGTPTVSEGGGGA